MPYLVLIPPALYLFAVGVIRIAAVGASFSMNRPIDSEEWKGIKRRSWSFGWGRSG